MSPRSKPPSACPPSTPPRAACWPTWTKWPTPSTGASRDRTIRQRSADAIRRREEMTMDEHLDRAVAVVGVGAIMPDAPDAAAFWDNIKDGRYSISDVDPARWDPHLYYDPDPKAPDKTYSKIGGWVKDWVWDPRSWKLPIMPRVADAIDDTQKWAVACTQQALTDYGYPERPLD